MELWKPIVGLEAYFEVSSFGRVRSKARSVRFLSRNGGEAWRAKQPKDLAPQIQNAGYALVHLTVDGQRVARTVHTLVARAFLGECPPRMEVLHWDGVKTNNCLDNLRYGTKQTNREDARRLGTLAVGERVASAKLTADDVTAIRATGGRSAAVASALGISGRQVRRIRSGDAWRHLL